MAIQRITHKKIKKYDTKNPNFNPESLKNQRKKLMEMLQKMIFMVRRNILINLIMVIFR